MKTLLEVTCFSQHGPLSGRACGHALSICLERLTRPLGVRIPDRQRKVSLARHSEPEDGNTEMKAGEARPAGLTQHPPRADPLPITWPRAGLSAPEAEASG